MKKDEKCFIDNQTAGVDAKLCEEMLSLISGFSFTAAKLMKTRNAMEIFVIGYNMKTRISFRKLISFIMLAFHDSY